MKILHIGDIHYSEKDHAEIKKCVDFAIEKAWEEKPDVVICPGDIINSQYLGADTKSLKTVMAQFREFSDIAPVAVIAGTFSHDGLAPELLKNVSGKFKIHVSTVAEQIYLVNNEWKNESSIIETDGSPFKVDLVVSQVPPMTKEFWKHRQGIEKDNENISEAMGAIFANFGVVAKEYNCPHIINGHFSVTGCKISETQLLPGSDINLDKDTIGMANADLCLLGHIHHSQQIGDNIFYSGSIFRKNFGERNSKKGFLVYDIEEV